MNKIEEWHALGLIEITRAPALRDELARFEGPQGQASREKAEGYSEGRSSFAFTARSPDGLSTARGGNTLRGPKAAYWVQPITAILFPDRRFEQLSPNDQGDVLHLAEHKINRWHYFITGDQRDILSNSQRLATEIGITVLSPEEAVREIAQILAACIFGTRCLSSP